jgi:hypothetical protein
MVRFLFSRVVVGLVVGLASVLVPAQDIGGHEVVKLWSNGAPEAQFDTRPEVVRIAPEGDHLITHVAEPSITPYLPRRRWRQARL